MIHLRSVLVTLIILIAATLAVGPVTAAASCVSSSITYQVDAADAAHDALLTNDPCGTSDDSPNIGASVPLLPLPENAWLEDALLVRNPVRHLSTQTVDQLESLTSHGPESPPPNTLAAPR